MTRRALSIAIAVVLALLGIVPLVTLRGIHRSPDSGMAWGIGNGMIVAPIWLLFVVVALVVDLRQARTRYALLAAPLFPIAFIVGIFIAG